MPIPRTTNINNWKRATQRVEAAVRSGQYVSAETSLIFVGPPHLSDINAGGSTFVAAGGGVSSDVFGATGESAFYPIGQAESFGMQQMHNVQKVFEIGSRRSYQVPGRVQVMGSIGRLVFNGPSLLRALYAYYPGIIQMANGEVIGPDSKDSVSRVVVGAGDAANPIYPRIFFEAGAGAGVNPETGATHSFFINLMSELFSHPFGLGIMMRDNRDVNYGAFYLEDCMITTHSINWTSAANLVTEACSFQADAAIPMKFSTNDE
jgi:hypothetical protein